MLTVNSTRLAFVRPLQLLQAKKKKKRENTSKK